MLSLPRFLTALLAAGAGIGALAATASADSIVYVKDGGNVWLTSPTAVNGVKTAGKPGINTLRFKGRIRGKTLRPGRYRLTISARAMVGGATVKATMAFRIVR